MKRILFIEIVAFLYMCLMLYTSASKLMDYNMTREQMAMMPLLTPISHIVVWLLPLIEVVIAVLLFLPRFKQLGLKLVTSLMLLFTIYIIYMMSYYKELPCSCGGFLAQLSWSEHIIFNVAFIALGILAIVFNKTRQQASKGSDVLLSQ